MKVIKIKAKEIFTKTKLPGADYVINQYVGCEHNCSYCYAKFISRWKKHGKWGDWVEIKTNAPDLVKNKFVPGWVFMSSVSDAYQPLEKDLKLTRSILENLDKSTKLSILTKSDLLLRDIDLFKKFKNIEVGLTINTFEGDEKKLFEPNSPSNGERIKALKILKENGIKNYAFVSPLIPGLINIEKLIINTKDFVDYYWFEVLNLGGAGKEFSEMLRHKYPESHKVLKDRKLFDLFINEVKNTCKMRGIQVKGFEEH